MKIKRYSTIEVGRYWGYCEFEYPYEIGIHKKLKGVLYWSTLIHEVGHWLINMLIPISIVKIRFHYVWEMIDIFIHSSNMPKDIAKVNKDYGLKFK